jgi:hypothetical protein
VLRYNSIPNRVLLEIANLANEDDRALLVTRKFRQKVAESVAVGLLDFFGGEKNEELSAPVLADRRGATKGNRPGEGVEAADLPTSRGSSPPYGPQPDLYGPWEIYGPMPGAGSSQAPPPSKKSPRRGSKRK